jgi:hypothetical protein
MTSDFTNEKEIEPIIGGFNIGAFVPLTDSRKKELPSKMLLFKAAKIQIAKALGLKLAPMPKKFTPDKGNVPMLNGTQAAATRGKNSFDI